MFVCNVRDRSCVQVVSAVFVCNVCDRSCVQVVSAVLCVMCVIGVVFKLLVQCCV